MLPTTSPTSPGHHTVVASAGVSANISPLALSDLLLKLNTACSGAVWGEPSLRPNQGKALVHISDPSKPRALLIVDRTGSGKTHITRVAGVVEKGITFILINLHSLSADQLAKFVEANQAYGTVEAHNADELYNQSRQLYYKVLRRARVLSVRTTSTMFFFASPQFVCNHPEFAQMLILQAEARVLRLVVLDEVHLHVQQGTSFRNAIRQLKDVFFCKVFKNSKVENRPKVIMATGTMTKKYVGLISDLTEIGLPPASVQWASFGDFEQRNIDMQFVCSNATTKKLDTVVDFLKGDDVHCACVFVGSREKSHKLNFELERKLDEALLGVDVIHVHGSLDPKEKYWFIRIFCAKIDVPELCAKVLLSTPAADVGIDNALVKFILVAGWPRDLCSYFQRRGRAGRVSGLESTIIQMGSVVSYVSIIFQICTTTAATTLDEDVALDQAVTVANSAVKAKKPTQFAKKDTKYDLTHHQRKTTCHQRSCRDIGRPSFLCF